MYRNFVQRLTQAGKPKMVVITALMRKRLPHCTSGIAKTNYI
ncbi:hypothetical protein [Rodentibacter rarus]|nr:hypothetical protein [Rodentibacter rarus]